MPKTWLRGKIIHEEDGRVMLLGLGACVLLSALILMTMSISGVYLEQRRLQRLADQTVSMAVSEVDEETYYRQGLVEGEPIPIDQAGAHKRATDYLSGVDSGMTPGLKNITISGFATQRTRVDLELSAVGKIPIFLPLISDIGEVTLHAKSNAGLKSSFG